MGEIKVSLAEYKLLCLFADSPLASSMTNAELVGSAGVGGVNNVSRAARSLKLAGFVRTFYESSVGGSSRSFVLTREGAEFVGRVRSGVSEFEVLVFKNSRLSNVAVASELRVPLWFVRLLIFEANVSVSYSAGNRVFRVG